MVYADSIGAEDYLPDQPLLAFNLRQQQFRPALGTVDVARPYNWFTEGFDTAALKNAKALHSGSNHPERIEL